MVSINRAPKRSYHCLQRQHVRTFVAAASILFFCVWPISISNVREDPKSLSSTSTAAMVSQSVNNTEAATAMSMAAAVATPNGDTSKTNVIKNENGTALEATRTRTNEISYFDAGGNENQDENENEEININMNMDIMCPKALVKVGAGYSSTSTVWKKLKKSVLEATYITHPDGLNATQVQAYRSWLDDLYKFYTPSRLRRSMANPAPPRAIVRLIELAEEIKAHNDELKKQSQMKGGDENVDVNVEDYEKNRRTMRILVMGGSVTAGHECFWFEDWNIKQHISFPHKNCAWPTRLEELLNHVLFEGERIVQVENMGMGGQTSEWGSLVLNYRIFPRPDVLPDVVISAYAANEAPDSNENERVFFDFMQDFVHATQSLRPCDDDGPLLIMADDFYGGRPFEATRQTGYMYMLSTWYNLMSVNHASVVKYKVLGEFVDVDSPHPLTHSRYTRHLGIGFHVGMAWTLLFNIVGAYVNVCNDYHDLDGGDDDDDTFVHDIHRSDKYVPPPHWKNRKNDTDEQNGEAKNVEETDEESSRDDPLVIDPDLVPSIRRGEPPFQRFSRISREFRDDNATFVATNLENNIVENDIFCDRYYDAEDNKKCTYAWFVNRITGFESQDAVRREMKKVLVSNEGWNAEGTPYGGTRQKVGWYTHQANAAFSMKIENIQVQTKYVILLTMKSYSEKWQGSRLAVIPRVVKGQGQVSNDNEDRQNNNEEEEAEVDAETFYIDGYHDIETSVHFPHKFPFPGNGANVGDTIMLDVKMEGGSEFKIAGMAFCSF